MRGPDMSEKVQPPEIDYNKVNEIIERYRGRKWSLIPLLQDIQREFGYIPPDAIASIADAVEVFPSQVQGVISFYTGLYTTPRGKNVVKVCRGTACHVRGGKTILKLVKQMLELEEGETSSDLEYTLETVACIGVCALAPNMVINADTYGQLNPKKVNQIFSAKERG